MVDFFIVILSVANIQYVNGNHTPHMNRFHSACIDIKPMQEVKCFKKIAVQSGVGVASVSIYCVQMQAVVLTNVPPSFQAEPSASNHMNEHSPPKAVHTATNPAVNICIHSRVCVL